MESFISGPALWYLNRSTGIVILGLLTLSVLLGVLATAGRVGGNVPRRFVSQALHRNVSLLSVLLLTIHVLTAVVDSYVDIRWWQAFSPWGATYAPFWMALGALSLDLIVLVVLTSLIRARMSHRPWRVIHLMSYAAWFLGVAHGLGIGTDMKSLDAWGVRFTIACVVLVVLAASVRLAGQLRSRTPVDSGVA